MDEKVLMIEFFHGLQFGPLNERLVLEPVANLRQLSQLIVKYIKLEEVKKVAKGAIEDQSKIELPRSPKRKPDKTLLPKPPKLRSYPNRKDPKLFCEYHKDHGHDTDDCRVLKAKIEKFIRIGHLKDFVKERSPRAVRGSPRRNEKQRSRSPPRVTGRIDTISGGLAGEEIPPIPESSMLEEPYTNWSYGHH
ncbi:hypothetical protein LIER_33120 [Lithospermum erythrorhizon]|uniref:Reverse transcriptase domain-containing protein n=1 Tax=Lithospermum erythrorhizon TaxID=34254 RepID=A0AAV3RZQ1_LITER